MYDRLLDRFESAQERLGTAGLIVAVLALIVALGGSAYALTGAEKKQISKEAKKFSKKFSKQFAKPGPAGTPGANGLPGAAGKDGAPGEDGTDGTNGTNGKNVETGIATVGECPAGGATVQVAGEDGTKKKVCNGLQGAQGEPGEPGEPGENGDPWTVGGVLPSEETLTGAWANSGVHNVGIGNELLASLSFPIRLPAAIGEEQIHLVNNAGEEFDFGTFEFGPAVNCLGSVAVPTAKPGELCIYIQATSSNFAFPVPEVRKPSGGAGAGVTGALLAFFIETSGPSFAQGSFAVTAP